MSVLILKNSSSEGPGTLGAYLASVHIPFSVVDLGHERIPDAGGFETLVMLGGPMSVNDEHAYPYLTEEIRLAERFMKQGRTVFGICLGAQLMARALGSRVYPGQSKELGWLDIELAPAGLNDPKMTALAREPETGVVDPVFPVFHWHGETFDVPAGAELLASSALYRNQAFRYGGCAYAFQFHIEVTKGMICDWMYTEPVDRDSLLRDTRELYETYEERSLNFYRALFAADRSAVPAQD